jgi:hypothetical protein
MVKLYRNQNGETLLTCDTCANTLPTVPGEKWETISVAADYDICEICGEAQELPEFPNGEFDNGGHWRGEE